MREEKGMVDAMRASVLCSTLLAIVFFSAAAIRAEGPIIKIVGRSAGRTFEGLGAECRRVVAVAAGLSRAAAERDPRFPLQAELRRIAAALEGRDRRRRQLDRRHRAQPRPHARGIRASAAGILPAGLRVVDHARGQAAQSADSARRVAMGRTAWIGGGKFWSQDNADFIAAFLHAANRQHGLDIDFCGLWNERPHNAAWIKVLRKTLDDRGLAQVKIIAADECDGGTMWNIGREVLADRELAAAVHAIGATIPIGIRPRSACRPPSRSSPAKTALGAATGRGPARWPRATTATTSRAR